MSGDQKPGGMRIVSMGGNADRRSFDRNVDAEAEVDGDEAPATALTAKPSRPVTGAPYRLYALLFILAAGVAAAGAMVMGWQ